MLPIMRKLRGRSDMPVKLNLAQRKILRKARGEMSQTELASRIGCRPMQISCYENGSKLPSEEMMKVIAKELGLKFKISTVVTLKRGRKKC